MIAGNNVIDEQKGMRSVLLIGLGRVSVEYDLFSKNNNQILSHAKAFAKHPSFYIAGGVDVNKEKRDRFKDEYNVKTYSDIRLAMIELDPEVVVVATPTEIHHITIDEVIKFGKPKVILCEKPLSYELDNAKSLVSQCKQNECALYVNYVRQVEPGVCDIRERIKEGKIQGPVRGITWYSKGMFNSASHFITMLQSLLGKVSAFKVIDKGRIWNACDPEPDFKIRFQQGEVVFLSAKEEDYFHNSVEIIAKNGRLRYEYSGDHVTWQGIETNEELAGYTNLSRYEELLHTEFGKLQWFVVEELANAIDSKESYLCTGEEALQTQEILEQITERL